jgi:hypothetical protein
MLTYNQAFGVYLALSLNIVFEDYSKQNKMPLQVQ